MMGGKGSGRVERMWKYSSILECERKCTFGEDVEKG